MNTLDKFQDILVIHVVLIAETSRHRAVRVSEAHAGVVTKLNQPNLDDLGEISPHPSALSSVPNINIHDGRCNIRSRSCAGFATFMPKMLQFPVRSLSWDIRSHCRS